MDAIVLIAFVAIAAFLVGAALGWWLCSRAGSGPLDELRERAAQGDERARSLDGELATARAEHATLTERAGRAGRLEAELEEMRTKRAALSERLASLESGQEARERALEERYAEREKHFERELARLVEAEDKLQAKFNAIGDKMLEGASAKFLEGAQTHLASMNKAGLAELEKKVGPVGETLDRYRKRVEELEKNRSEAWHQLQGVIGEVRAGQERVVEGANRITTTLQGATKARGDWGELQFENLLDSCGLRDRTDFKREENVKDEDGRDMRPDAIINIPGGRKLIVDVKNVFNTYKEANEAETEEQRTVLLAKHAKEVRGHVQALSARRYQDHVKGSADFVVMFVPGEHVLYAALMQDESLLNYALERNVVLSSPLNFMSIALTVATVWRQAGVQADAEEIATLGKQIYDRLAIVAKKISDLRRDLGKTNNSFDALIGSFDTNLRKAGERFDKLSVDTSAKDLAEALPLNSQPRKLVNFPDDDGYQDEEGASPALPAQSERDAAE